MSVFIASHTRHMRVRGTGVRAIIVALIAGAAGLLSVQAALGQDEKQVEAGEAVYNDYCQTCHGAIW